MVQGLPGLRSLWFVAEKNKRDFDQSAFNDYRTNWLLNSIHTIKNMFYSISFIKACGKICRECACAEHLCVGWSTRANYVTLLVEGKLLDAELNS